MKECELCLLPIKKKIYKETDEYIIIDCMSCDVPMIVWKEHIHPDDSLGIHANKNIHQIMAKALTLVAIGEYGSGNFYTDTSERTIMDHIHWHARPIIHKKEDKSLWICKACGKSTYETEYDYLAARNLHLECALKEEMK